MVVIDIFIHIAIVTLSLKNNLNHRLKLSPFLMKDLVVRRLHVGDPIIPGGVDWPRERCLIVLAKDVKEMTGKTMLYVACFELFFVVKAKNAAMSYTVNVVNDIYLANDKTKWNITFSASLLCFEFWAIFFRMMMKLKLVFKFRLASDFFTWTRKCPSLWENRLLGPDKEYI